jgi:hypothetical protein
MVDEKNFIRVAFPVSEPSLGLVEYLFTAKVAGGYRLDNSPFYAYGVSQGDVVEADHIDGLLTFRRVNERGGHSTYRVKLAKNRSHSDFMMHWSELEKLGCSFEGSSASERRLYAIDVTPNADVDRVVAILEELESFGFWEYEEAHYFDCSEQPLGSG